MESSKIMDGEKFTFKRLDTSEQLDEAFRLRYQVYGHECHFIDPNDFPQGFETDEFDQHSVHFGGFDLDQHMIGAVRLILPFCPEFPIESHCPQMTIDREVIRRDECAEISRLVISKLYRRRSGDGLYYEAQAQDQKGQDSAGKFLRRMRPMAFGLYRAVYHESRRAGINYWFALMEKSLWLLLKIHGFVFEPVGPEVDFYGKVTPYIADLRKLETNVRLKFPKFFDFFMQGLDADLQPKA